MSNLYIVNYNTHEQAIRSTDSRVFSNYNDAVTFADNSGFSGYILKMDKPKNVIKMFFGLFAPSSQELITIAAYTAER